ALFTVPLDHFEKVAELAVASSALGAIADMFGRARVKRLTESLGEAELVQPIVAQVAGASDHGWPPSSVRNLRAALNHCPRTVDSFRPVMTLTSRGVQSP